VRKLTRSHKVFEMMPFDVITKIAHIDPLKFVSEHNDRAGFSSVILTDGLVGKTLEGSTTFAL